MERIRTAGKSNLVNAIAVRVGVVARELILEEARTRLEEERKRLEEERKKNEEERKRLEVARKKFEEERKKNEKEKRWLEEAKMKLIEWKRGEMPTEVETTVTIDTASALNSASRSIATLVVSSRCCNDEDVIELDLRRFTNLREVRVGNECFANVNRVKLTGMHLLERVEIGANCMYYDEYKWERNGRNRERHFWDRRGHFYLKDCEKLKELKIGCESFRDYSVCEIENVPSLEVIEMGELNEWSANFYRASLELKSDDDGMK